MESIWPIYFAHVRLTLYSYIHDLLDVDIAFPTNVHIRAIVYIKAADRHNFVRQLFRSDFRIQTVHLRSRLLAASYILLKIYNVHCTSIRSGLDKYII